MAQERLWNTNYCKVMTANFALFFAFYVLTPLLPLYLKEHFGATKDVIGLVLSGYTLTALLFRPFSGFVVDAFPRKTVLLVCYTAFAIFFAGYLASAITACPTIWLWLSRPLSASSSIVTPIALSCSSGLRLSSRLLGWLSMQR